MQLAEGAATQAVRQKQEIFETLHTACNPLFQFFLKFSSDKRSPGDLFDQRFQKIEVELNRLVKRARTDGGPETAGPNRESFFKPVSPLGGNAFGLNGSVAPKDWIDTSPGQTRDPRLDQGKRLGLDSEARFNKLEAQLTELKNQLQAKAVVLGG